jgi:hypothetical protein
MVPPRRQRNLDGRLRSRSYGFSHPSIRLLLRQNEKIVGFIEVIAEFHRAELPDRHRRHHWKGIDLKRFFVLPINDRGAPQMTLESVRLER